MKRSKVLLGMSGGVDSSVAALLLIEQGYEVEGVTLQVWEEEDEEVSATKRWQERGCCKVGLARHVAKLLGISHQLVDTWEKFRLGVVDDFVSGYLEGTTPNPCVRCNERVKFGELYRLAKSKGFDFVATGHYARIHHTENGYGLYKGSDFKKDQSYFLYRISRSWLPHILFPLGNLQKSEVWQRAAALELPTDELRESQEICFVTQSDYRAFLRTAAPNVECPGPFVDMEGQYLGEHQGIAFYTPGQRKGLGIATGERLYVYEVIPETNTVVLGKADALNRTECMISDMNWLGDDLSNKTESVAIKFRYASTEVSGKISPSSSGKIRIEFTHPQKGLSPGQSAVFYKDDRVLGGGIIQRFNSSSKNKRPLAKESLHSITG